MIKHDQGRSFLNHLPEIRQELPVSAKIFKLLFSLTSAHSTASLDDIARLLKQDQGLAVKILAMANSAYYGLQSEVASIQRAVLVLGLREVRKMVVMMSIRTLEQRIQAKDFDIFSHWRHQVEVAHVCRELVRDLPGQDAEELFTAGLLHDLGKMITAIYRPEDWHAIEDLQRSHNLPLYQAEDAYWGLDHALIGALTLKSWFLPQSLTAPINWHHAPSLADAHCASATVLRLADLLVHQHMNDGPDDAQDLVALDCAKLGIAPDATTGLVAEIIAQGHPDIFLQGMGLTQPVEGHTP